MLLYECVLVQVLQSIDNILECAIDAVEEAD